MDALCRPRGLRKGVERYTVAVNNPSLGKGVPETHCEGAVSVSRRCDRDEHINGAKPKRLRHRPNEV